MPTASLPLAANPPSPHPQETKANSPPSPTEDNPYAEEPFCILCGSAIIKPEPEVIVHPCKHGSLHQECWLDHVDKYGSRCPYCHCRVKFTETILDGNEE
ncbi:hypothetical protein BZA77DRAFT_348942 [Pyronema omphalodes]|nr:hypothetical protein BZA77DRAFT_348942 [Pyronema omphalodes]